MILAGTIVVTFVLAFAALLIFIFSQKKQDGSSR